jgi:hypothetical protein
VVAVLHSRLSEVQSPWRLIDETVVLVSTVRTRLEDRVGEACIKPQQGRRILQAKRRARSEDTRDIPPQRRTSSQHPRRALPCTFPPANAVLPVLPRGRGARATPHPPRSTISASAMVSSLVATGCERAPRRLVRVFAAGGRSDAPFQVRARVLGNSSTRNPNP